MMSKRGSVMIDTVPLPEKIREVEIPMKLLREFEKEGKVILRYPYPFPVGIPIPDRFMDKLGIDLKGEFELMLIPK